MLLPRVNAWCIVVIPQKHQLRRYLHLSCMRTIIYWKIRILQLKEQIKGIGKKKHSLGNFIRLLGTDPGVYLVVVDIKVDGNWWNYKHCIGQLKHNSIIVIVITTFYHFQSTFFRSSWIHWLNCFVMVRWGLGIVMVKCIFLYNFFNVLFWIFRQQLCRRLNKTFIGGFSRVESSRQNGIFDLIQLAFRLDPSCFSIWFKSFSIRSEKYLNQVQVERIPFFERPNEPCVTYWKLFGIEFAKDATQIFHQLLKKWQIFLINR